MVNLSNSNSLEENYNGGKFGWLKNEAFYSNLTAISENIEQAKE